MPLILANTIKVFMRYYEELIGVRRNSVQRVVKRRIKKFPSKKGGEPMNRRFDWTCVVK